MEKSVMKILHVSPECAPLAKKGGLGDVAYALPKALRKNGVDARVLIPAWPGVLDAARDLGALRSRPFATISAALDWRVLSAKLWRATIDELPIYILENDRLFSNTDIYPEETNAESAEPMIFLSYAAFELADAAHWKPLILHAHDWPAAMIPSALRHHRHYSSMAGDYDTVYTIHNMAHQGLFSPECLDGWGIKPESFVPMSAGSLEFYGRVNLMKGAIDNAEAITTVSPRYSWDIQTKEGGFGLDGVMSENKRKLRGILNGIDCDVWNPKRDRLLPANFDASELEGKKICRAAVMQRFAWEDDGRPLLVFVGRLTEQKGVDIMLGALSELPKESVYVLIIGSGSEYYGGRVAEFAAAHAENVRTVTGFSEEKAHLAYAAGDLLLMPSLFEPCGLSQLIALASGTIPVARAPGGLCDTVIDADGTEDGNGFLFADYSAEELRGAIRRAAEAMRDAARWKRIIKNAMSRDSSWNIPAKEYAALYQEIVESE